MKQCSNRFASITVPREFPFVKAPYAGFPAFWMFTNRFPRITQSRTATPSIPSWIVERHEAQALRNHSQTVQRLKERQGCSWRELLAILTDRRFQDVSVMSNSAAMVEVVSIVAKLDPDWMERWRAFCAEREAARLRSLNNAQANWPRAAF